MDELRVSILLLCTLSLLHASRGNSSQSLADEFARTSDTIPQYNNVPINVTLSFKLVNMIEADKDKDQVEVVVWIQTDWVVPSYGTLLEEYNLNQLSLPSSKIWHPDISVYNAITPPQILSADRVVVFRGGNLIYLPSRSVRVVCDLRNVDVPQGATCRIKVGPWTYHNRQMTLSISQDLNVHDYFDSQKYEILSTRQTKNSWTYSCCNDVYEDIELFFTFKKK